MKLKRDFILYSKPNKQLPKFKTSDNELDRIYKKIPLLIMQENPEIKKAFKPEKKPYIMGIKKYLKPDLIRIKKEMSESDVKMFTKINDMKEIVYNINNEEDDKEFEKIVEENKLFDKIYTKLKEDKNKFRLGNYLDYKSFLNISSQYVAKKMKVPNLSTEHNLFSPNPLILQGSELENYILYNYGDRTKGVKFLKKLDDYLEKRLRGINKMSVKEMERIEKIKREEKPKGYIPPDTEISMLKKDISNSETTYKNLVELEEFFKPKEKRFILSSIKRNNSNYNLYKNSLEKSSIIIPKRIISSSFSPENIYQNNSSFIPTTSIGMSTKPSPKDSNPNSVFNLNNFMINVPRDFHYKLPKLKPSLRTPSSLFSNSRNNSKKKIRIKKISFNDSLGSYSNSLPKSELSPVFKSIKQFRNPFHKLWIKNKMDEYLKLSSRNSNNENKEKEHDSILTKSKIDEQNKSNKTIEKNNISNLNINKTQDKEEKENKTRNKIEKNEESNKENDNDNKKSFDLELLRKARKRKTVKLKNLKNIKVSNTSKKSKSIFIPKMPNLIFNGIRVDPFEERYKKVENLFNIVKKEEKIINLKKETKRKVEKFLRSRRKNIKTMLTPKNNYFALKNIMSLSKDSKVVLEEYKIRNRFKLKESVLNGQQIFLDKNKGFIKEILKQEAKINDIFYKDNKDLTSEY